MIDRREELASRRVQYEAAGLDVGDVAADPLTQWSRWYADASAAGITEPNAMVVSTVADDGGADARFVLVRDQDDRGLVFHTNTDSTKGRQLAARPLASGLFAWLDLHRQVRVRGPVEPIDAATSDAYFASRPRASQIGAWASPQSQPIADRTTLDRLVDAVTVRFDGAEIRRPPFWGGYRLVVEEAEFWQGRPNRLHDRLRYRRAGPGPGWLVERLAP